MRWRWTGRRVSLVVAIVVLAPYVYRAATWLRPTPKLLLARDTTWLTEPLKGDGSVDYERAWREERSRGVTPENNAAPLAFAAAGLDTTQFSEAERAQLPKVEEPFVAIDVWAGAHGKEFEKPAKKSSSPVTAAMEAIERGDVESPPGRGANAWLEAMAPSLDLVTKAAERDRFFVPTAWGKRRADAWSFLEVSRGFRWRATRAMARDDADAAGAAIRVAMKLARLERDVGVDVYFYIGFGDEEYLAEAALNTARTHGRCSTKVIHAITEAADPTPVEPCLQDYLRATRWLRLDALDRTAHSKLSEMEGLDSPAVFARLDPNLLRRHLNGRLDREEAALVADLPWTERLRRFAELRSDWKDSTSTWKSASTMTVLWRGPDAAARGLIDTGFYRPDIAKDYILNPLCRTERALIELAALAYATDTGHDPKTSDDLTPSLFATPWRDRVTRSSVTFERDADGNLVARGPLVDLINSLK